MEKKENINSKKLIQIMWNRKKIVGSIIMGCTILAVIISFIVPKQYESTTLVQTRSKTDLGSAGALASMMGMGGSGRANSPVNYIGLMKSRHVVEPIIESMEWNSEKEKPEADAFIKKHIDIINVPQTNLIKITATGRTPEEAQIISQSVADNFLEMQTNMSQQTQSLLLKFLSERIDTAKSEAEEASKKFAEYRKEHKVYSPDEQAKAAVSKMNAFDDAIGNMEVQQRAEQAKVDTVSAKLRDMNISSLTYNINDNATVQGLRKQIVSKQVELVVLTQQYTEEHPAVIASKKELAQLQQSLTKEVNAVVGSKYTSMSPAQAALVQDEANAEAAIAVADASKKALQQRRDEKQKELGDFPNEVMQYMNLQRDATIKNEVYVNLVKQCEEGKIQEAMESMDIQIIDMANLPSQDKPAFPRKKLFLIVGFVAGIVISLIYSFWVSKRKEN